MASDPRDLEVRRLAVEEATRKFDSAMRRDNCIATAFVALFVLVWLAILVFC